MAGAPIIGIYCIRNIVSGRHYVGSAANIRGRWRAHRHLLRLGKHHSPSLQRSWARHGESAFVFEIVETLADIAGLLVREQHWIDELNAADPQRGFNVSAVSGTRRGVPQSTAARAKMSAANRVKPKSPEHRAKIGAAQKWRRMTDEQKAHLSALAKQQWADPAARAKIITADGFGKGHPKGWKMSARAKAKIATAAAARMQTDEGRAHQRRIAALGGAVLAKRSRPE